MDTCKNNYTIMCDDQTKCYKCGWCPEVAEKRAIKVRQQLKHTKEFFAIDFQERRSDEKIK